ncbi:MAG TPA: ABC transporter permease, partial [Candidatus Polarisedimenticolia bacterium]|nr:ABC transporter permease [Candidatus Polarisedimenticolia bacterium]
MRRYLLRRLLAAPALLLGVLTLTFLLVHAAPGEPFAADPAAGLDPHAAGRLRAVFGADLPLHIRYLRWMEAAVRFDLGISYTHRRPVVEVLGSALGPTLILMFSALALAVLCGVAAALAAVSARSGLASRALTALAVTAYASPGFWVGVLLVQVVSVRLGWLPASGWRSIDPAGGWLAGSLLDVARHLVLPSLTLAAPAAGGIALHLRAALEESLAGAVTLGELARGASRRR